MSRFVGDYRYGGCEVGGEKFSVILNGGRIERIRRIAHKGEPENPIVWQDGQSMTVQVIEIISAARYEVSQP